MNEIKTNFYITHLGDDIITTHQDTCYKVPIGTLLKINGINGKVFENGSKSHKKIKHFDYHTNKWDSLIEKEFNMLLPCSLKNRILLKSSVNWSLYCTLKVHSPIKYKTEETVILEIKDTSNGTMFKIKSDNFMGLPSSKEVTIENFRPIGQLHPGIPAIQEPTSEDSHRTVMDGMQSGLTVVFSNPMINDNRNAHGHSRDNRNTGQGNFQGTSRDATPISKPNSRNTDKGYSQEIAYLFGCEVPLEWLKQLVPVKDSRYIDKIVTFHLRNEGPFEGTVRYVGLYESLCCYGIVLNHGAIDGGTNGEFYNCPLFQCKRGRGILVTAEIFQRILKETLETRTPKAASNRSQTNLPGGYPQNTGNTPKVHPNPGNNYEETQNSKNEEMLKKQQTGQFPGGAVQQHQAVVTQQPRSDNSLTAAAGVVTRSQAKHEPEKPPPKPKIEWHGVKLFGGNYVFNEDTVLKLQSKRPPKGRWPILDTLGMDHAVEFTIKRYQAEEEIYHGSIKWMGLEVTPGQKPFAWIGVEVDNHITFGTNGTFLGKQLFTCQDNHGFMVPGELIRPDARFDFGDKFEDRGEQPNLDIAQRPILGKCPARGDLDEEELKTWLDKWRGIQGRHNSCYLDSTLFAMFSFNSLFDGILHKDIAVTDSGVRDMQTQIRDSIVNPLRINRYVPHESILGLRSLLDKLSSMKGMKTDEKDPDEFLNFLFSNFMKKEQQMYFTNGTDANLFQLFLLEKPANWIVPTTQQIVECVLYQYDMKLTKVPSCMIFQMPRDGVRFKMFPKIRQSLYLDITNIVENCPKRCILCDNLADIECRECFNHNYHYPVESTFYCKKHAKSEHRRLEKPDHVKTFRDVKKLDGCGDEWNDKYKVEMELFAVLCIETSHYVAYVKAGNKEDSPWIFFDSMAFRFGQNDADAYNAPSITSVPKMAEWLADEKGDWFTETVENDKELKRRLISDSYVCFYRNQNLTMYT